MKEYGIQAYFDDLEQWFCMSYAQGIAIPAMYSAEKANEIMAQVLQSAKASGRQGYYRLVCREVSPWKVVKREAS